MEKVEEEEKEEEKVEKVEEEEEPCMYMYILLCTYHIFPSLLPGISTTRNLYHTTLSLSDCVHMTDETVNR